MPTKKFITKLIQKNVPMDKKGHALIAIAAKSRKQWNKDIKSGRVFVKNGNLYMKMTRRQWAKKEKASKKRMRKR